MKKFLNVLDKAFVVTQSTKSIREECIICDGIGEVSVKHKKFVCPQCNGAGNKTTSFTEWVVKGPATLEQVLLSKEDGFQERYIYNIPSPTLYLNGTYKVKLKPEDVFGNFEDAASEACRRNQKSFMDDNSLNHRQKEVSL